MKKEEIHVREEYASAFETFCTRNQIPFTLYSRWGQYTYTLRPGADHTDALIMSLKMGWTGNNKKNINLINLLVMDHMYLNVLYDYELTLAWRWDEDILSSFS